MTDFKEQWEETMAMLDAEQDSMASPAFIFLRHMWEELIKAGFSSTEASVLVGAFLATSAGGSHEE